MNHMLLQLPIYIYIMALFILIACIAQGYWKGIFREWMKIFWEYKWLFLGLIFLILFFVFFADYRITWYLHTHKNPIFTAMANTGNIIGNGKFMYSILATLIFAGLIFNRAKSKFTILIKISIMSCAYAGIAVLVFKTIIERQRPFVSFNPFHFFDYAQAIKLHEFGHFRYLSMPSGHAIVATSAMIPFFLYFRKKIWGWLFLLVPLLVMFSRVYSTMHWTSDVSVAFILGFTIALSAFRISKHKFKETGK